MEPKCLSQGHLARNQCNWNLGPGLPDSKVVPLLWHSTWVQSGARGDGLGSKGAPDGGGVPEWAGTVAPGRDGMLATPSP